MRKNFATLFSQKNSTALRTPPDQQTEQKKIVYLLSRCRFPCRRYDCLPHVFCPIFAKRTFLPRAFCDTLRKKAQAFRQTAFYRKKPFPPTKKDRLFAKKCRTVFFLLFCFDTTMFFCPKALQLDDFRFRHCLLDQCGQFR